MIHGKDRGKIAHAHLVAAKHHQNADSGGVPEHLIKFRKLKQSVLVGHMLPHLGNYRFVGR